MNAWIIWLIIAGVLLIAELMTGVLFCLCLSLAALFTFFFSWILTPFAQGVVFAVWSTLFLLIWARWRRLQVQRETPHVSEIQHQLLGHQLVLSAALAPSAQVRVGDSYWLARSIDGESLAVGSKVEVVAIEGTTLVVRAV
jgi:membrane protein implicated in regulation of membrane protease activity